MLMMVNMATAREMARISFLFIIMLAEPDSSF